MILKYLSHSPNMQVMHAMQCVNSHEFRRHPPGSLLISSVREDLRACGWEISVTLEPAPVHKFIDGGKSVIVDVYDTVNFTKLFRGFRGRKRFE
jgi:hypothetical protein